MRARAISSITLAAVLSSSLLPGIAMAVEVGSPEPVDGEPWIVYNGVVESGSGIRLVRPDGSGDHAPFDGLPGEAWHPDWSPDGRSIAFAVDDSDGTRDLWIGFVDGSDVVRHYDCAAPCSWADDPAWSPDGTTILFQQGAAVGDEGLGVSTIESLDLGTGTIRTIASGGSGEWFYVPRWAPDGLGLVVEIDRFATGLLAETEVVGSTVATVDVGTAAVQDLVPDDRRATYPDWSPAGSHIVFQAPVDPSRPDGPSELYTVSKEGGDVEPLTSIGADGRQALQPTWTPDGRVIFVEQDGMFENVRMAVVDADGGSLASATGEVDLFGTHPRLRPAGQASGSPPEVRQFVYQAPIVGSDDTESRVVRDDGTADRPLVTGRLPFPDHAHPDWSPDGTRVAFDVWSDDEPARIELTGADRGRTRLRTHIDPRPGR